MSHPLQYIYHMYSTCTEVYIPHPLQDVLMSSPNTMPYPRPVVYVHVLYMWYMWYMYLCTCAVHVLYIHVCMWVVTLCSVYAHTGFSCIESTEACGFPNTVYMHVQETVNAKVNVRAHVNTM